MRRSMHSVMQAVRSPRNGGGAHVKTPPFCDTYSSFTWNTNNSLLYSNLAGSGPDTWSNNQGIHFANVMPESGLPVDVLITTTSAYFPHPDIPNVRFKEFLSIGVSSGSAVGLLWSFRDQVYEVPVLQTGVYMTVANFVSEEGSDGSKWMIVCDFADIVLSQNDEPLVNVEPVNESCSKLSSMVAGPEWPMNETVKIRALTPNQEARSVSILFKAFAEIRMELGAAPGPKGVHFLFGGQSNLPCPIRAMCETYTCPKFFQLVDKPETTYCAASECTDIPDRNYCCVPAVMETCEPAQTLLMAPGALKASNLAGKGPDLKEPPLMVFKDVFPASGISVNFQIRATSVYTPANTSWNGQHGSYGSINVQEGTSVDLVFEFVKAKSGKPFKVKYPFIFSILDFDKQYDGGAIEKVTISGQDKYWLTENTRVLEGTDAMNRTIFKAADSGDEEDNPDDPMNLSQSALDKSVSLLFEPCQSIEMTFSVSPGWPGSGRNFMFAGWTEIPCPKSSLCMYMKCPAGMVLKEDAENLMCQGDECDADVDSTICCQQTIIEICDRKYQMPFARGSLMSNNLGSRGPDQDTPAFMTISDVFPHSGTVIDLDIFSTTAYFPGDPSRNGINMTGYLVINVKSGTSVELRLRFRAKGPPAQSDPDMHPFMLSFYDLDTEPGGGGTKMVTVIGDFLQHDIARESKISVKASDSTLAFNGTEPDEPGDEPDTIPELLDNRRKQKTVSVAFRSIWRDTILKLEVGPGSDEGHDFLIGGKAVIPCGVKPEMCTKYVCPYGYKLKKESHTIPCSGDKCLDDEDLSVCCERNLWTEQLCGRDTSMFFSEDSVSHSNLGGYGPGDPTLVFGDVFPNYNKTIDLVISGMSPYKVASPAVAKRNGMKGLMGTIAIEATSATEFSFELWDRAAGHRLIVPETFPFWFTVVGMSRDLAGGGKQEIHLPKQSFVESVVSDNTFIESHPDKFIAQAYSRFVDPNTIVHPLALDVAQKHSSVAFLFEKPSWRMRFSVLGGNSTMNFTFVGSSNLVCPERQTCADHICPVGFERKLSATHQVCRESVCGGEVDNSVCCQPIGCNEPNVLGFSDSSVRVSNLGGMGPDSEPNQPEVLVYTNVFPGSNATVDMEVSVRDVYYPNDVTHNGVLGEYGQINIKSGSATTFLFKFFDNETGKAYKPDPFFFSIFDIDRGSAGAEETVSVRGFQWYQVGRQSEVEIRTRENVEDGNVKKDVEFSASTWGTYKDNPRHPLALSPLQLNRSVTFMMPSVEDFEMVISVASGLAGRNILFGGASSLTCKVRALCIEHTCPSSFRLRKDPHMHICAGEKCTADDTGRCCEAVHGTAPPSLLRKEHRSHIRIKYNGTIVDKLTGTQMSSDEHVIHNSVGSSLLRTRPKHKKHHHVHHHHHHHRHHHHRASSNTSGSTHGSEPSKEVLKIVDGKDHQI